jgi:hypothetical protein
MKHFKIFLASPSDTAKERLKTQEIVNEINKTSGKDEYTIELFLWEENTYSAIGEDGQDVINNQNFDYDIFIGIMSHKFGSPTKRALSATAEEYEIALQKYKDKKVKNIMFYFNSSELPYNIDLEQFTKVKEFKSKIQKDGVLTKNYDKKNSFDKVLRSELILSIKDFLKKENESFILSQNNSNNYIPEIKKTFLDYLNDMEATFAHPNKDKVFLEDIYISPDLQRLDRNQKSNLNKTIKLSVLNDAIDFDGIKNVFLGDELAGKTASCKYNFQKYFNQNMLPIIINGEEINNNIKIEIIEKIIEKNIVNQYSVPFLLSEINYDDVIIIIDDFHKSAKGFNKYWHTLIRNLESKFKNIILTGIPLMTIDTANNEPFKNFDVFQILEFGPILRKEIVQKWKRLNINDKYIDKNELLRNEDEALQHIKTAIGKNYFPVFPFYILSMLQALEGNSVSNPNYSIHGFYYENLINRCFSRFISNKKEINLYYNYLTYFCYFLFEKEVKSLSIKEFKEFHASYCKKVDITFSVEKIMQTFNDASLLSINHNVSVKEKYVYYFFVAKYLADNINNENEVKTVISKMSIRIFRDDYANIILFITHLSKDKFIIDELIKNANSIFNDIEPTKLDEDIKNINKLVESIPIQVLKSVNVDEKREIELIEQEQSEKDEKEFENETKSYNHIGLEDDISTIDFLAWLTMAFKTIDILGQIAKKHWGEMDGELKIKLVNSTYNLGLRFLGYYLQMLQTNSSEIVEHLTKIFNTKTFKDTHSLKKSIEEETRDYIFRLCFMATFGTTKRISSSVSDIELKQTFAKVLEENPNNAYQLIDLGIKLIYSGIPMQQVKELKEIMTKNNLCLMVLQNLIIDHSYMFEISHIERSQINSIFGTGVKEQLVIDVTSKIKRE